MGLLTRKTDSNPLSKNIDELLDGRNQEKEETKEGTYEESLKKRHHWCLSFFNDQNITLLIVNFYEK